MNNAEIELLKMQIEAYEKLIRIKQDTIAELEKQLAMRPLFPQLPHISVPSVWQVDPCQHEYPNPWGGTSPPNCIKCGKPSYPSYTITSNSTSVDGISQTAISAKASW